MLFLSSATPLSRSTDKLLLATLLPIGHSCLIARTRVVSCAGATRAVSACTFAGWVPLSLSHPLPPSASH
eukprot:6186351-Pleurochrysis_carterae.AAC.2